MANVVATGDLRQTVNLAKSGKLRYVTYHPRVYHCSYVLTPRMKYKVSVFSTGKMISAGNHSEKAARNDLLTASNYLSEHGLIKEVNPGARIRNIVLVGALRSFDIRASLPSLEQLGKTIYEPEQFPGIIHYPSALAGVAMLLFDSGKFVVAGVKSFAMGFAIRKYLDTIAGFSDSQAVDKTHRT